MVRGTLLFELEKHDGEISKTALCRRSVTDRGGRYRPDHPDPFLKATTREGFFGDNLFRTGAMSPTAHPRRLYPQQPHLRRADTGCQAELRLRFQPGHAVKALARLWLPGCGLQFFADIFRGNALNNILLLLTGSGIFLCRTSSRPSNRIQNGISG